MPATSLWNALALGLPAVLLALVALLLLGSALRRRSRNARLTAEERRALGRLPLTPLQRRAWWGLAVGVALATLAGAVIWQRGPASFSEDDALRAFVLGVVVVVGLADILLLRVPRLRTGKGAMVLDERDERVLHRAPTVQSRIVLLSLIAWSIGLTEAYAEEGAIPIGYTYLLLMSTLIVHVVAYSAGILVGYWMVQNDAQG